MGRKVIELSIVTLALVGLQGCPGGGQSQPVTGGGQEVAPANVSGGISQEQIDEIEATRRGGMTAIVGCFNDEIERGKNHKLHGKVMVEIQIGTAGRALSVGIKRSTFKSTKIQTCIQNTIKSWEFPRLTSTFNYPTTFEFSPAY
jgi:hypothetical protein